MKRIAYFKPISVTVSFTVVADKYIAALRELGYRVDVYDIGKPRALEEEYDICVLHPILYPMTKYPRTWRRLLRRCKEWVGFDVCDSNHVSHIASYALSMFDRVAVPSNFCKAVYERSAVTSIVYVVPHHLDEEFFRDDVEADRGPALLLNKYPAAKFLYFLWHSGWRKGADVVAEAWTRYVKERSGLLVLKRTKHVDPFHAFFADLPKVYEIERWLSTEELVALYDAVDVVLVPSRGGGFELNALEALARGKIVITSEWPPIQEYCKECIRVKTRGKVRVFPENSVEGLIHDGYGVDPDPEDLYMKMLHVVDNLERYREVFMRARERVRKEYSFEAVRDRLIDFVEGR